MNDAAKSPVRFSTLKEMRKSPAHFRHALTRNWSSDFLRKGQALHSHLLGGPEVITFKGGARRGKAWKAFKEEHAGAILLSPAEAAAADGMRRSIESNREAMRLLDGMREQDIKWKIGDRECAGRPDVYRRSSIVELKTAKTVDPEWFPRDAMRLGYHAQLTWYADGLRAAGLADPEQAFIVAVESSEPYPCVVYELTRNAIEAGRKQWRIWFERLLVCEDNDHWPGYCESIVPLDADNELDELVFGDAEQEEASLEELGL